MIIDIRNVPAPKFPLEVEAVLTKGWSSFSSYLKNFKFDKGRCKITIAEEADWFRLQRVALIIPELEVHVPELNAPIVDVAKTSPSETIPEKSNDVSDSIKELQAKTIKELREQAQIHGIVLKGLSKKAEIVKCILDSLTK